ncbi:LTA synthase family protein [Lutispora thermophila]|uniref:Phosphoglycerol transferase MdoB n=1 Tax=Lutispora thermophila DSM 19022 TaxID=1122184 RepID=A0A1M6BAF5_9FIRM|nr:alkaline phosphatase family protein [Lutispora thermophila]SHI45443.1 Phosphoglycerol transferase MdoB [Lutispora thermophila DSM 19022]
MLIYFIVSLFYLETILRASLGEDFFSSGFLISLIFSVPFAFISYIICTAFSSSINYIITMAIMILWALIFASQILYYKLFKTFYTLFSVGNAGQIIEFWRDILALMANNISWIILSFIPCISMIWLKEFMIFAGITMKTRLIIICGAIVFHIIGVAFICSGQKNQYSAYDLYFNNDYPLMSVKKLGLITYMRLDIQRLIFGWSPKIAEPKEIIHSGKIIDEPDPTAEEIKYNTLGIDFVKLISNEQNETIEKMHNYFMNVKPTKKNDYTGKYKGYNLILITAESFSPYAVHKDVTPTLYKMVHEGYHFTDFYTPIWGVSTSDGEYVACTGLIPKRGVWSFIVSANRYMPYAMGNQLKKLGYTTKAYHNNTYTYYKRNLSHPNMGYEYKGVGNGLDIKTSWPASDLEMMKMTIPEYINKEPFHAYYMTVSGHMRYSFTGNAMAAKNRKLVENLPYSQAGKAYVACQIELDRALEYLLNKLEDSGVADRTLIALSSDHYPYGLDLKDIDLLAGHKVDRDFELYKNHFILYTSGMEPVTIDKPCSSLDILPTISNLMGLDYDSRLLMGRDIFSDAEPLVMFESKSFITDKGRYNSLKGIFTPKPDAKVDEDYVNNIKNIVDSKFYYSAKILETDYYKYVSK